MTTYIRKTSKRETAPMTWSVYDFILREIKGGHDFPRRNAIAAGLDQSLPAVDDALLRLCSWGKITRTPKQYPARSYRYDLAETSLVRISKSG